MIQNESYQYVLRACAIPNQKVGDAWRACIGMRSLATLNCLIALSATEDCLGHIKEAVSLLDEVRKSNE